MERQPIQWRSPLRIRLVVTYNPTRSQIRSVFGSHVRVAYEVDVGLRVNVTSTVLVAPPPVRVMVALFAPTEAVAVFTLTVRVLLFEAGED